MNRRVTRQTTALQRLYPGLDVPQTTNDEEATQEPDDVDTAVREVLQAAVDAVTRAEPPPSVSVTCEYMVSC